MYCFLSPWILIILLFEVFLSKYQPALFKPLCLVIISLFSQICIRFVHFYRTFKETSTRNYCAVFLKFHFSYIIFSVWVSACCIFKWYVIKSLIKSIEPNKFSQIVRNNYRWEILALQIFDIKKKNTAKQSNYLGHISCKETF